MKDPKCRHARRGIVTTGDYVQGEPHAAVNVCDRQDCIEDALLWVNRKTLSRTARFVRDINYTRDELGIVRQDGV